MKAFFAAGLLVALALAFFVSPLASSEPDGLNRVAIDHHIDAHEQAHALDDLPTAGYGDDGMGPAVAGVIGVVVTLGLSGGLFWLVRRRNPA